MVASTPCSDIYGVMFAFVMMVVILLSKLSWFGWLNCRCSCVVHVVLSFLLTTVLLLASESPAWDNWVPPGVSLQLFLVSSNCQCRPVHGQRNIVASGLTISSCAAWWLLWMSVAASG